MGMAGITCTYSPCYNYGLPSMGMAGITSTSQSWTAIDGNGRNHLDGSASADGSKTTSCEKVCSPASALVGMGSTN